MFLIRFAKLQLDFNEFFMCGKKFLKADKSLHHELYIMREKGQEKLLIGIFLNNS